MNEKTLSILAEEARVSSVAAEASMEDWRHEEAALKFVQLAKVIRDPVTQRAVALVGHNHARKAQALKETGKSSTKQEEQVPTRRASETAVTMSTKKTSNLWVGDILALERRLHSLRGKSRAMDKEKITSRSIQDDPDSFTEWWSKVQNEKINLDVYLGQELEILHNNDENDIELVAAAKREEALARALKTLSDENTILRRRRDELEAEQASVKAVAERVEQFKILYQKKFEGLKAALEDFRHAHPSPSNPANALASPVDPEPPRPYSQLETEIRQLKAQLSTEREFSRKKDAVIERYEHWYRALKASANKRSSASTASQRSHTPATPSSSTLLLGLHATTTQPPSITENYDHHYRQYRNTSNIASEEDLNSSVV
uniref:Uncharacterized protein n=1 Tax=Aureoumbra lagunensis TaxID=44058 RepID=A0A7S3K5Z8_9STRA|mmetsp:Transcript_2180/g.3391  ORF Transcript_2180/g.3391 Transcript_2180/m.3391 type:complete len:375 (+) Transcript_2180:30-1154(+)